MTDGLDSPSAHLSRSTLPAQRQRSGDLEIHTVDAAAKLATRAGRGSDPQHSYQRLSKAVPTSAPESRPHSPHPAWPHGKGAAAE